MKKVPWVENDPYYNASLEILLGERYVMTDPKAEQHGQGWRRVGRRIHGYGLEIICLTSNDAALGTGVLNILQTNRDRLVQALEEIAKMAPNDSGVGAWAAEVARAALDAYRQARAGV